MKFKTILILVLIVGILGAAVAVRFLVQPDKITVAGDNYLGYWVIQSPYFKEQLRSSGYALKWVNDGGKYAERLEKFAKGQYDIMVLPVNSYIQHGESYHYPGGIVTVISDSKGADSVVVYKSKILPSGKQDVTVNDLNNPNLKICYTTGSPSSFLLNTAIVHFDLAALKQKGVWQVETVSSREALEKFSQPEGKRVCDAAVLWEPDVSKALKIPDVVSVYGSDQISGMILDVPVIQRRLVDESSDLKRATAFFKAYFGALEYYNTNPDKRHKEIRNIYGKGVFKSPKELEDAVGRILWFDLKDNCNEWFGPSARIADTVTQVRKIMKEVGDVQSDPPQLKPYLDKNRVLTQLCREMSQGSVNIGASVSAQRVFTSLSDTEWGQLRPIGTMKILPILFQSGTSILTAEGQRVVDEAIIALQHDFSQHRVIIKGHTAPSSDEAANLILSQDRAESVRQYFVSRGIDANRVKAAGAGSKDPLVRQRGEGELSYRSRLARVEFILYEDKK